MATSHKTKLTAVGFSDAQADQVLKAAPGAQAGPVVALAEKFSRVEGFDLGKFIAFIQVIIAHPEIWRALLDIFSPTPEP